MLTLNKRKLVSTTVAVAVAVTLILPTGVLGAVGDFKTFLTSQSAAQYTLDANAPRDITVTAPKKYIESIEVIHKKGGAIADDSVSITNIDVVTKGSEVGSIVIKATGASDRTVLPYATEGSVKSFQLGLANLANTYDLAIEVHNQANPGGNSTLIETMVFIVPEGSSDIFKISQKFTYKTSGANYTLYELLANRATFNDLLSEHKLDKIDMNNLRVTP